MDKEFYDFENVTEVPDVGNLISSRAKGVYRAIRKNRDYSLIKILRNNVRNESSTEIFVVEVTCDGVPSRNTVGIRYQERLALCIPTDPKKLVDVLALRRDFPVLIHQNLGRLGAPISLCLYFAPPDVVLRTWTPETFLRCIQWWLEKSAQGTLHPVDQPVEHLFFQSPYELVLPWNMEQLQQNAEQQFTIAYKSENPDKGGTFFLIPVNSLHTPTKVAKFLGITLPSIVHGNIEREPGYLGQLSDLLQQRNFPFFERLRETIQNNVSTKGASATEHDNLTVLLLKIPISRTVGATAEQITYRAFLLPICFLDLGVECGALTKYQNRYLVDKRLLHKSSWRKLPLLPMEVLKHNDTFSARQQSGIKDPGPNSVLIGAGSLGSMLLNLWGRSGWGCWSVIDNDHIKPHNLSRHTAYAQHVGTPKAKVVANLHTAVMLGASTITPIVGNACDFEQTTVVSTLKNAEIVIDASTTLEYPRLASTNDHLPRHCSVFITPNGDSAVLLAEDKQRTKRLRTLEAQYYRALIEQDWGKFHLRGNMGHFWSGASCRDSSLIMPYSRIVAHASTLAEQIQSATENNEAMIRVWHRNPSRGDVSVYDVSVCSEHCIEFGDLNLYIDEGALDQLRRLRQRELPNETGGILLGYYDFNIQAVIIVKGLSAPFDSKASTSFFERGTQDLDIAVREASERTANIISYIGEWHSHPPMFSSSPSRADIQQTIYMASKMAEDGFPFIQLIIGETEFEVIHSSEL